MRFSLIDPVKKTTLIFPVNPNELEVSMGTKTISFSHIASGESKIPRGAIPKEFSISGILPTKDTNLPELNSDLNVFEVTNQIDKWQQQDKKTVKLIITETPWNLDVLIEDFTIRLVGKLYYFSMRAIQSEERTIKKTTSKPTKKTKKRPVKKPKTKVYMVKQGDNLWNISKKHTGKGGRWSEMWKINKSKSKSKNPNLIYPGEKFTIPSGW